MVLFRLKLSKNGGESSREMPKVINKWRHIELFAVTQDLRKTNRQLKDYGSWE